MSCDLSYRGHKLTVSWQKDSFSFDISMKSSFWFESLHSTASATAPSTHAKRMKSTCPHMTSRGSRVQQGNLYSASKNHDSSSVRTARGFPSAHCFSLRSIFLSHSILWDSFEVFTMNLHILVAQIYSINTKPTVSTKRHLTPDWWNCWAFARNIRLSLTHNLVRSRA